MFNKICIALSLLFTFAAEARSTWVRVPVAQVHCNMTGLRYSTRTFELAIDVPKTFWSSTRHFMRFPGNQRKLYHACVAASAQAPGESLYLNMETGEILPESGNFQREELCEIQGRGCP